MIASCWLRAALPGRKPLVGIALALWMFCLPGAYAQTTVPPALLADAPSAATTDATEKTIDRSVPLGERFRVYEKSVFSLETVIGPALAAGIGQARNEPARWDQGGEGFARRYGSAAGVNAIAKTITFGFAAIDREDPRYFRSPDRSVLGRVKHGVVSSLVSSTASGRQIPAFSRFAGIYGAEFIANTWYPDNRATAAEAAKRGSVALGAAIGFRVLTEFMPFLSGRFEK